MSHSPSGSVCEPGFPPLDRLVVRAGQAVQRAVERAAADEGIGATAVRILGAVADHSPVSQRDLAAHVGVTPATLTPVLDRLEALGALQRKRNQHDRRLVHTTITPAGHELLRAASAAVTTGVRERLPQPGPEAAGVLREYLLAVIATFDDNGLPGPGSSRGPA